jgi:hypothetical protein
MTRPTLAATLAVCFTIACTSGKTEGPNTEPDPLTSKEGFCEAWAEAACNDTVVDACVAPSRTACRADQTQFCLRRVPDGRYELEAAEDCLAEVRSAYSDAVLTPEEYRTVVGSEQDGFGSPCGNELRWGAEGAPGPGEECDARLLPCAGENLICVREASDAGVVTVCRGIVIRTGGETCGRPREVCEAGTYCDGSVDPNRCYARLGLGEDCTDWPCREHLFCDETSNLCEAKGGLGDPCGSDEECSTGICLISSDRTLCADEVELSAFSPICRELS